MKINKYALSIMLFNKFKQIGVEKTLGSFTIEEIEELSEYIEEFVSSENNKVDEPPF